MTWDMILDWLNCRSIQDWYHLLSLPLAAVAICLLYKRANSARDQVKVAEADSLSNRYQRAAEMIGSENRSTRVAGFYSLKHLMQAHPTDYHVMTMELTCMFLRQPPRQTLDDGSIPLRGSHGWLREDLQAALDVIGSRNTRAIETESDAEFMPVLMSAQLQYAILKNANLSGALMTAASLEWAKCADVDFSGAGLDGGIDLTFADFHSVNFYKVSLEDARCDGAVFSSCKFNGSRLDRARMKGVSFEGVHFYGADMDKTDFTGSQFDASCRITQHQLDCAIANPEDIPKLAEDMVDYETNQPLVWNTALCGREWKDDPL